MFRASTMMGSWNGSVAARLSTIVPGPGNAATVSDTVLHPMLAAIGGSPAVAGIPGLGVGSIMSGFGAVAGLTSGSNVGNIELRQTMIDFMQDIVAGKGIIAAIDPALIQSMLDRIDDMPGLDIGTMMLGSGGTPGVANGTMIGNVVNAPGFAQGMLDIMDDMPGIHLVGLPHMGFNFSQIG